jgi:RNA-directed DNA polymerase
VNTDVLWPDRELAEWQVLRIQIKLHQWAIDDPDRRFDDLFNLVCDPAVLVVAWARVRGNRGKRAAGVDGLRPQSIFSAEEEFLPRLRHDLKARLFTPLPVRERMIPKPGSTKLRRLGIPTARDRTVQAALKLVLEPIFEADFKPCSYGFRPRWRAQDAIAEIHQFTSRSYEWVLEGDIEACFDMIDHPALMDRVRSRVGDKRVLAVVKSFLHADVLGEDGIMRDSTTGTPQGASCRHRWPTSPSQSSTSTSPRPGGRAGAAHTNGPSDAEAGSPTIGSSATPTTSWCWWPGRRRMRRLCGRRWRRSSPDGSAPVGREDAGLPHRRGLRLSGIPHPAEAQTRHNQACGLHLPVEEGTRLHRREGPHAHPQVIPSDTCGPAAQLNPVLRGWCTYFRHGVSKATFGYLDQYTWHRVVRWIRKRHNRTKWDVLYRCYLPRWRPVEDGVVLFQP